MKLGKYVEKTNKGLKTPVVFVDERVHADSEALRDERNWGLGAPQRLASLGADSYYLTTVESGEHNGKKGIRYVHQTLGTLPGREVWFRVVSHNCLLESQPVTRIYVTETEVTPIRGHR